MQDAESESAQTIRSIDKMDCPNHRFLCLQRTSPKREDPPRPDFERQAIKRI